VRTRGTLFALTGVQTVDIKDPCPSHEAKRVLLLEDDEVFKRLIKEFLEMNYFTVKAVSNGADGVRAVVKEDFDIIVCDMMMPKLPGDMFYTAIERMRPELCKRFIFITGHGGDMKIHNFIQKVRGTMLPKPFHMEDLLEAIAIVQVRNTGR
jgi:DNA-binding response OmpR family regulator